MADFAARIRAARGWADLTQEKLAERLGVDVQTIKRREKPPSEPGAQEPKRGERIAIASICGIPPEFMEDGFAGRATSEINDRLEAIETMLRQLLAEAAVSAAEGQSQTDTEDLPNTDPQPGPQP